MSRHKLTYGGCFYRYLGLKEAYKHWLGKHTVSTPELWKTFLVLLHNNISNDNWVLSYIYLFELQSDMEKMLSNKSHVLLEDDSELCELYTQFQKSMASFRAEHDEEDLFLMRWVEENDFFTWHLYLDLKSIYEKSKFFELCELLSKPQYFNLFGLD